MNNTTLPVERTTTLVGARTNDVELDQMAGAKGYAYVLVWLILGLVVFIIWAAIFEIDQSVRAQGQVIPSARSQLIQTADGGVLSEIYVHEGDAVEQGQLLAVLEREKSQSSYDEVRSMIASLEATRYRATAEANDAPLIFGEALDEYPSIVAAETQLFEQRKQALDSQLAVLYEALNMARQELNMQESLLASGDTSQLEVMRSRRQVSDAQGQVMSIQNDYYSRAREELSKVESELFIQRHRLEDRRYVLGHTELRSPVRGSVKLLNVNTLGGVLRPGDELMQISPTESDVLFEVKIDPRDVAQLKLGLPVSIKLDAFDYPIYGALDGTLDYVSTDTLTEESRGNTLTYYRAHVLVNEEQRNPLLSSSMIKHGMTGSVDIQTGARSVLEFIAKPIVRAFDGALTQR